MIVLVCSSGRDSCFAGYLGLVKEPFPAVLFNFGKVSSVVLVI